MLKKLFRTHAKLKILFIVLFPVLLIGLFEYLSRVCDSRQKLIESISDIDCVTLMDKYAKSPIPESANEDVQWFAENRVVYIDRAEMARANGVACILGWAFVANDLPAPAKRFVAYHEAVHLSGVHNETQANIEAFKYEPFGLFVTILYSVFYGMVNTPIQKMPCRLGGLWFVFKVYFLGESF